MKGVGVKPNQAVPAVASQGASGVQGRKEEEEEEEEAGEHVDKRRTLGSLASSAEVSHADGDQKKKKKNICQGENGANARVAPCPDRRLTPDPSEGLPGAPVTGDTGTRPLSGAVPVCCGERRWRQKEHHSDMDLRRVDSFGQGEESAGRQGLGRSLSEGSCVNPSLASFPSPIPSGAGINLNLKHHMRRQTVGPCVLPNNVPTSISSHHSFCLGDLRVESDRDGNAGGGCPSTESASQNPREQSGQADFVTVPTAEQISNRLV